eukprot:CFRG3830T1
MALENIYRPPSESIPLWISIWVVIFMCVIAIGTSCPYQISSTRWCVAIVLPLVFMARGLKNRSLSISGAVCGWVVAVSHGLSDLTVLCSLIVFFLSASKLTKLHQEKKRAIEDDFKDGGQRNYVQVISNGGPGMVLSFAVLLLCGPGETYIDFDGDSDMWLRSLLVLGAVSSYSCCNGDTWASEVGTVMNGDEDPILVTTLDRVPTGTNGGVSPVGLLASTLGGLTCGLAHWTSIHAFSSFHGNIHDMPPQWPVVVLGALVGLYGSLLDSVLGATLQYSGWDTERKVVVSAPGVGIKHISGMSLLSNHNVNLLSATLTSVIVCLIAPYIWPSN